jgi:hypothetical protein
MEGDAMNKRKMVAAGVASLVLFLGATGFASADQDNGVGTSFLCPIVGDGVLDAPGIDAISPPAGTSILPGKNQAGLHANAHALNSHEGGTPTAGNVPGAEGFTPIWTDNPS